MEGLSPVELLAERHDVSEFDCGNEELTRWLQRYGLMNQRQDGARTFVVHRAGRVAGYYALATGSLRHDDAPQRIRKVLGGYPIPILLIARLAVDLEEQGKGLGAALMKDALLRCVQVSENVAVRAVLVHAIDEAAMGFYRHFDLEPSPTDPTDMLLLMKDLREGVAGSQRTAMSPDRGCSDTAAGRRPT